MALKDWEKTIRNGTTIWKKAKIYPRLELGKNMMGNYQLNLFRGSGSTTIFGIYKRKKDGTKFARSYMRKH